MEDYRKNYPDPTKDPEKESPYQLQTQRVPIDDVA